MLLNTVSRAKCNSVHIKIDNILNIVIKRQQLGKFLYKLPSMCSLHDVQKIKAYKTHRVYLHVCIVLARYLLDEFCWNFVSVVCHCNLHPAFSNNNMADVRISEVTSTLEVLNLCVVTDV